MQQKSLIKNAMYNFAYTGLNLLFPLITAPYISRTLGAENLGKVNFATVIVNWFLLFAIFGTTTYGIREVAKNRENKKELNKIFSEIFFINIFLSTIVSVIYFVLIFNVNQFKQELPLYLIMSLNIILNMFAIDWFYQGIEEYGYITVRSAIFKIISLVCIFLFVKKSENYVIYGTISILATSLSGILNFVHSKKYVQLSSKGINPLRHIKPLSTFFLHTFVVSLYTNLDQTLLGFITNKESVAFMNRSKMITGMAISVSTSISNVTLPRASYYIKNDFKKFTELLSSIPNYILMITIPIMTGCIIFSSNIMYILGGNEFLEASSLLKMVALIIIFSPLSSYLQNQVLISTGNEKMGLNSALISSLISIVLNIILIPKYGYLGAGFAVVCAELSAVLTRYYFVKTKLGYNNIKFLNKSSLSYILAAFLMGIIANIIRLTFKNMLLSFVLGGIVGSFFYFIFLIFLKEKIIISIFKKMKKNSN